MVQPEFPNFAETQKRVARQVRATFDALVAGSGLNYWPSPRPRPILWLAIDDGKGARLVNSRQLAVVRPLAERGLERGLRFGMPSGSAVSPAGATSCR